MTESSAEKSKPISVAIVEDELLVARMLNALLSGNKRFGVVGCAHDGRAGLALCLAKRPDVALIDIMMPGLDGISVAERLMEEAPGIRIIVLSARLAPYSIYRIHQLNIPGCVDKASSPDVVEEAILAVASGRTFLTASFAAQWKELEHNPDAFFKILSDREIAVLQSLARGMSAGDTAQLLDISSDTVKTHQRNIRKKLGAHNAVDLLKHARQTGIF
jgi:DNA-binding NarL/FixJ family response regulator